MKKKILNPLQPKGMIKPPTLPNPRIMREGVEVINNPTNEQMKKYGLGDFYQVRDDVETKSNSESLNQSTKVNENFVTLTKERMNSIMSEMESLKKTVHRQGREIQSLKSQTSVISKMRSMITSLQPKNTPRRDIDG